MLYVWSDTNVPAVYPDGGRLRLLHDDGAELTLHREYSRCASHEVRQADASVSLT